MKCFFCNNTMDIINDRLNVVRCRADCDDFFVNHFLKLNPDDPDGGMMLDKVEFGTKLNGIFYFICYTLHPSKREATSCKIQFIDYNPIDKSAGFETLLTLNYPPITLTPTNVNDKLPTYLTFL